MTKASWFDCYWFVWQGFCVDHFVCFFVRRCRLIQIIYVQCLALWVGREGGEGRREGEWEICKYICLTGSFINYVQELFSYAKAYS